MQLLFTARHVAIDDSLTDYCEQRLKKMARYALEPTIIEIRFEDVRGGLKEGRDKLVCLTVTPPHEKHSDHFEALSDDFRTSFNLARDRLAMYLRQLHDKNLHCPRSIKSGEI